jgi:protocatechuate 3,4-dioxygenase beta subunit
MTGVVWLSASTLLFARLALSQIAVWRLLRQAAPCNEASLLAAASEASRRVGLARPPRLLVSSAVPTPMILALTRPRLLLPAGQYIPAGEIDWTTIFTHELAHAARGDGWSRLCVQLVTIVLPLSPLVWLAQRAFFEACEDACDDWAVAYGSDPIDLAMMLSAWIDCPPCRGSLVAIGMSSTKARILRLLALHARPIARLGGGWRWASLLAACVLIAGLAAAQTTERDPDATAIVLKNGKSAQDQSPQMQGNKNGKQPSAGITISGTCVDENKKPLAKARVRLFFSEFPSDDILQRQIADVRADNDGRFRLTSANLTVDDMQNVRAHQASLIVVAQAPGKATAIGRWIEHEQTIDLTLPPAASMQGRIVDPEGKAVPGAVVDVWYLPKPVPGIGAAVTDALGRYEISDLRPYERESKLQPVGDGRMGSFGAPHAKVQHPDYARQVFQYTKVPSTVDVTLHRPAVVEGQIVTAENGQPAVGVPVQFCNDIVRADYWTRSITDERGRYKLAEFPPGEYRVNAKLKGRPNLFRLDVPLHVGANTLDLRMEKGGTIKGRVIDVSTGKPPELGKGQRMQIGDSVKKNGGWMSYDGMNHADVQPDGTFTLLVPSGRNHLSMYLGPNWRGVNTDELLEEGVEVSEGQIVELEVRVKPHTQ